MPRHAAEDPVRASRIADLGPLADTPLERLNCQTRRSAVWSQSRGCRWEINFDYDPARDAELVERLSKVPRINGPGDEFWARVGDQNKRPP